VTVKCAGITDVGRKRKNNEDNFYYDSEYGFFIVADGMGGHLAGEVASKMAVEIIGENLKNYIQGDKNQCMLCPYDEDLSPISNHMISATKLANQVIYESSTSKAELVGMGTTVVAAVLWDRYWSFANVGDSRIYLVRNGDLIQVSEDHSLVAEQVRRGLLTEEQAQKSSIKNILTRALGTDLDVEVFTDEMPALDGDIVLLCSDGLTNMVEESQILSTILENEELPEQLCDSLVQQANNNGGLDNITVIYAKTSCDDEKKNGICSKLLGFIKLLLG
jgi:serine/threonine protein phosphatase PrpC